MERVEDLQVIYEDNHVIVVIKPQNIPTQKDETEDLDMLTMVKDYIKVKYNKPGNVYVGLVHRLDRPTGGLLVFAKTSKAASRLSEQIQNGEFDKRYLTVVEGPLNEKTKHLQHYLKKDEKTNTVKIVPMSESGAKKAELIYNVLDVYNEYVEVQRKAIKKVRINVHEDLTQEENNEIFTDKVVTKTLTLAEVKLLTGRSHQIRVQMASLKAPVFGDVKYGNTKAENTKNLALWAYELTFTHPTTKRKMSFKVLPDTEKEPWNKFNFNKI